MLSARCPVTPADPRQGRALASDAKNCILLEKHLLSGDLEAQIEAFVEHYNHQRCCESQDKVTPVDAYFDQAPAIIILREKIKQQTIEHRRLQQRNLAV